MHIAYIHQHFSTRKGATGTRSYEMAKRLIAAGHRVTMICGVNAATKDALASFGAVTRQDIDGIGVLCIGEKYANEMGFYRRVVAFRNFANKALQATLDAKPDLVFATSTPLTVGVPGLKAARKLGVPFVFEVRDLWPEMLVAMGAIRNPFVRWYLERMERRIYRAADHIISLAPGITDGICRAGYPREKVTLIPNCADLDLFRPDPGPLDDARFGAPDDFRVVFTGAHGMTNGLENVLDAAAELKRRGVRGVRFVFIGQGILREKLMQRSRDEGLDELTAWIPLLPKDELARVLPRMNVGLMVLRNVPGFGYCTSPNKFFDYIACGLPVLNNYAGWLAEMITRDQCGRVVPPDDPRAFADAVLWLRDHPDERRAMGARARALAEREFDRNHHGRVFVQTLEVAARREASR